MPKGGGRKSNQMDVSDDMMDEVDLFTETRGQHALNKKGSKNGLNGMEKRRNIMDLEMSEEDSDEDMGEYEEDSELESGEEGGMEVGGSEGSEGSGEDEEEFDDRNWGRKKSAYHKRHDESGDEFSSGDEEALAEEAEARRLQKRKAAERREEDFDDSFASRTAALKKSEASKMGRMTSTDAGLLETMYKDMAFHPKSSAADDDDEADMMLTSDGRDLSALSKQEKLDLITKDSPELLLLLDSFNAKIKEIRERIAPLIQRARDQQIPTSKGMSYLETKYHLLLNYCTNVCFYLLLKAEGKSVKNHPVIEHLARTRTIIDRLKPLDQKLKYQIDKLLKLAAQGEANLQSDPKLRHRANIKGFIPMEQDVDEDGSEGAGDDSGDEDVDESDLVGRPGANGKYMVPKFAATGDVDEKRRTREEKRAKKSAMSEYLTEEFGERPLERSLAVGSADKSLREAQKEREQYEEDNFVRLGLTKKEKKAQKKSVFVDEFADFADYGDLEALDRADVLHKADDLESRAFSAKRKNRGGEDERGGGQRDKMASILDSLDKRAEASAAAKGPRYGVDEDIDYDSIMQDKKAKKAKLREDREKAELQHIIDREKRETDLALGLVDSGKKSKKKSTTANLLDALDDDDDFYKETVAAQRAAKDEKKAADRAARSQRKSERETAEAEESGDDDGEDAVGDGKRKASKMIEQNRGLRKTKKKELSNSRVKFAKRFGKAVQKMKSRGPGEASNAARFSGTSKNISKHVVRSTSLS